MKEHSTNF